MEIVGTKNSYSKPPEKDNYNFGHISRADGLEKQIFS